MLTDALSQLPLLELATTQIPSELVLLADLPVTASQISPWTSKDLELATVVQFLWQGWLNMIDQDTTKQTSLPDFSFLLC